MNNKFINNNGANLLNTKSQIEILKNQEQAISKELWVWETKQKKAERLVNYLDEVNRFSTKFLAEAVAVEKEKENCSDWWLQNLIGNKVEFTLKFKPIAEAFTKLVFQKIEN